jgi:hypothetical protein
LPFVSTKTNQPQEIYRHRKNVSTGKISQQQIPLGMAQAFCLPNAFSRSFSRTSALRHGLASSCDSMDECTKAGRIGTTAAPVPLKDQVFRRLGVT